jgi:hypothetical protein
LKAKAILVDLHQNGESPVYNKSAEEQYAFHSEFRKYPFNHFKENLDSLCGAVKREK